MLYLNSKIISENQARIDTRDRGFLLGDGLFETIACHQAAAFNLNAHWDRLQKGAHFLSIPLLLSFQEASNIIAELIQQNDLYEGVIRVTLSRGKSLRGIDVPLDISPTLLITAEKYKRESTPLKLCFVDMPINEASPLTRIKALTYLDKIIARRQARHNHYDDALLTNTKNRIVCTTSANIFFISNNAIYTPSDEEGALPGTTREIVLKIASRCGIATYVQPIETSFLKRVDEVFITNCLIGIRSVEQIDEMTFDIDGKRSLATLLKRDYATVIPAKAGIQD